MSWSWIEGGTHKRPRKLGGFTTRELAQQSAIYNASLKHVDDPALIKTLWASLEGAGWSIEYAP